MSERVDTVSSARSLSQLRTWWGCGREEGEKKMWERERKRGRDTEKEEVEDGGSRKVRKRGYYEETLLHTVVAMLKVLLWYTHTPSAWLSQTPSVATSAQSEPSSPSTSPPSAPASC